MSPEELVKDVMEKKVQTLDLNASAKKSAAVMAKQGIGSLVVVQGGRAVGIVTERDLVSKVIADGLDPAKVLVRDIMSTPLITIQPDAKIAEAARLMNEYKIRRVVVTAADGSLAGIVTATDFARVLAERKDYSDTTLNAIARASTDKSPYQ
jgi:CBS domain-containing protein